MEKSLSSEESLGMLFAPKQVAKPTKNAEPQVYTEGHEDSLIAPSIILPKVENTANDNASTPNRAFSVISVVRKTSPPWDSPLN